MNAYKVKEGNYSSKVPGEFIFIILFVFSAIAVINYSDIQNLIGVFFGFLIILSIYRYLTVRKLSKIEVTSDGILLTNKKKGTSEIIERKNIEQIVVRVSSRFSQADRTNKINKSRWDATIRRLYSWRIPKKGLTFTHWVILTFITPQKSYPFKTSWKVVQSIQNDLLSYKYPPISNLNNSSNTHVIEKKLFDWNIYLLLGFIILVVLGILSIVIYFSLTGNLLYFNSK